MADFASLGPWEGAGVPVAIGEVTLAPLPATPIVSIAPFRNRAADVAGMLGAPLGIGAAVPLAGGRLVWAGLDLWFLMGAPAPDLAGVAAVADQGDGWAGLAVTGATAADVLARLVPLDLAVLPVGTAARSLLGHVATLLIVVRDGYHLLVPRSYAGTAAEELIHAARAVAARAGI